MRRQIVRTIFRKEMLELFRDKKTMFMMVIFPILLYPFIMIGTTKITMISYKNTEDKRQNIVLDFKVDRQLKGIIDEYKGETGKLKLVTSKNPKRDLEEDKISAYVLEESLNNQTIYQIYMKASKDDSSNAAASLKEVFSLYNDELVKQNIKGAGLNVEETLEPITSEKIDLSKGEEKAGYLLGMILPTILIIGIMMGAIYPAIDIMAGEKERGTLETLLTLPLTNLELIVGKYMAVSAIAIIAAIINALGLSLSMAYMLITVGGQEQDLLADVDLARMIMPAIIAFIGLILLSLIFSAVSMIVCSMASSYKEAQNYMSPLMILGMLPSMIAMVPNITLNRKTAMIPVGNVALLIKGVLTFKYDIISIAIVIIVNIGFVALSIWILARLYNTESILFGKGHGLSFLQKRSELVGGKMPTLGDGIAVYSITLLAFIYIGTLIQVKFGILGVALSQIIIIGIPTWIVYHTKAPFKKVFSISWPSFRDILASFCIWSGAFVFSNLLSQITLYFSPKNLELLEELNKSILSSESIWVSLLVIGILPAICEEALFRGYLLSATSQGEKFKRGIIISSLMFGAMHLYPIKLLPTAILGASFAYVVHKTGSIFPGMLMHFINNAIAVFILYYPNGQFANIFLWFDNNLIAFIVLGIAIFLGGVTLLNSRQIDS